MGKIKFVPKALENRKNTIDNSKVSLEYAFKEYEKYTIAINQSPKTVVYHYECFKHFVKSIMYYKEEEGNNNKKILCSDISRKDIQNFSVYGLSVIKIKPVTVNSRMQNIAGFLRYCYENKYFEERIKILKVRYKKSLKPTYTEDEVYMLTQRPKNPTFTEYRTWVMIGMLVCCCPRLEIMRSLKNKHVDFKYNGIWMEHTKNGESFFVPVDDEFMKILQEYMDIRGGEPDDCLFCTENGEQFSGGGIQSAINRYNKKKGVPRTGVHKFRHFFAIEWLMDGKDPLTLQRILGHSSLEMVNVYAALTNYHIKHIYDNSNKSKYFKSPNKIKMPKAG